MKNNDTVFLSDELALMPEQFAKILHKLPTDSLNWKPDSWEGVPGESFSALEQICHLRDIEIDGYQARIHRILSEDHPKFFPIDGYKYAKDREYILQNSETVLEEFKTARSKTVEMLSNLDSDVMKRPAFFKSYGEITLGSLFWFIRSHDLQHLSCMNWLLGKIERSES